MHAWKKKCQAKATFTAAPSPAADAQVIARISRVIAAAVRCFYSWHFSLPIGATRFAVVTPDGMAGILVLLICWPPSVLLSPVYLVVSPGILMVGSLAFVVLSPLVAWQVAIVSADRTTLVRVLLVVPYWFTRIPPGTGAELYEAWEDRAPSSVAYKLRNDYAHIGNGWNAEPLFELLRKCENRLRSSSSG